MKIEFVQIRNRTGKFFLALLVLFLTITITQWLDLTTAEKVVESQAKRTWAGDDRGRNELLELLGACAEGQMPAGVGRMALTTTECRLSIESRLHRPIILDMLTMRIAAECAVRSLREGVNAPLRWLLEVGWGIGGNAATLPSDTV